MLDPIEVEIGDITVSARPCDGSIGDGNVTVTSMYADIQDEQYITLEEEIPWTAEAIKESIRSTWMDEEDTWADTSDRSWTTTRVVNQGTIKWDILEYVQQKYPCTTAEIDEALGLDDTASAYVSKMKQSHVLACIGYEERSQLIVPTHIGMKELQTVHGSGDTLQQPLNSGLDRLFDGQEEPLE